MAIADPAGLAADADHLAASGDVARARRALEALVEIAPDGATWLKLGSMRRASGDLTGALDAVNEALTFAPLDFLGLISRAALLERLGSGEAGEAYGRALAQCPAGDLPPQLEAMVAHARAVVAAHVAAGGARLDQLVEPALARASPEESARIARFKTNTLRSTRAWHSEPTHFHYPGLIEREFHERAEFPWLATLEAAIDTIRAEFDAVACAERAELTPYVQYAAHEPLEQWRTLNHSRDWTAVHLLKNGAQVEANTRHCPETMALLARLPQPDIAGCSPNAMFSLLAPGIMIPPHHGITNTRLVCHLPLIVPSGCWFRVGAETRIWTPGEAFVFDDTIEHEAGNPTDALRVVLIFDVWHPGLSDVERAAARAVQMTEADQAGLAL